MQVYYRTICKLNSCRIPYVGTLSTFPPYRIKPPPLQAKRPCPLHHALDPSGRTGMARVGEVEWRVEMARDLPPSGSEGGRPERSAAKVTGPYTWQDWAISIQVVPARRTVGRLAGPISSPSLSVQVQRGPGPFPPRRIGGEERVPYG